MNLDYIALPDLLALIFFFVCWVGYAHFTSI